MGAGTDQDYATVKYDSWGGEQWVARYNGPINGVDYATAIAVDGLGNVYVTGQSEGSSANYDYATIKYAPTGLMEYKNTTAKEEDLMTTIFRGPLLLPEGKQCRVIDITGRVVEPTKITRGIYFIEIDNRIVRKVVKIR